MIHPQELPLVRRREDGQIVATPEYDALALETLSNKQREVVQAQVKRQTEAL